MCIRDRIFLQHSRSNTIGTKVALNPGDVVGKLSFRSYNSDLSGFKSNATISAVVTGAATTDGVPSALVFSTGESISNAQEKVRITSGGRVGIGSTIPTEALEVRGNGVFLNSGNDTNISIGETVGNNNAYIDFRGDSTYTDYGLRVLRNDGGANTTSDFRHRGTGAIRIVAEDAGSIQFFTSGAAASN